jgi:hypothetical protein
MPLGLTILRGICHHLHLHIHLDPSDNKEVEIIVCFFVCLMALNATFKNISAISWQSVLLVEETGENHQPVASH